MGTFDTVNPKSNVDKTTNDSITMNRSRKVLKRLSCYFLSAAHIAPKGVSCLQVAGKGSAAHKARSGISA